MRASTKTVLYEDIENTCNFYINYKYKIYNCILNNMIVENKIVDRKM